MIRIVSECFKTYIDWHIELVLFICLGKITDVIKTNC